MDCVEALGAWVRICKLEMDQKKHFVENGGGLTPLYEHPVNVKTYCVIIAAKGKPLYAQSAAMQSNAKVR